MKNFINFLFCLLSGVAFAQTTILIEDFEDATVTYSTSIADDLNRIDELDYFGRIDANSGLPATVEFQNKQGSGFYGAQDTDGVNDQDVHTIELNWSNIDISGYTDLNLSWFVAEDDSGDSEEDWDQSSSVRIEVQIDGGGYTNIFAIESADGFAINSEPRVDTNFDGIGDGTPITDSFAQFSSNLTEGLILDIRLIIEDLDIGDEDIAFDNLLLTGNEGDKIAPQITCLDDLKMSTEENSCETRFPIEFPTATDNVSDSNNINIAGKRRDGLTLSDPYPLGETIIDWTATDEAGNTSESCEQLITIEDNENPTISCEEDIKKVGSGSETVTVVPPTISDNCTLNPTLTFVRSDDVDLTLDDAFPQGVTTLTWTVVDDSDNMATCTQTVTISMPLSMENDMALFSIPDQATGTKINLFEHTVAVEMPPNTDLSELTPNNIRVSSGATVAPESGIAQDFSQPVTYTITAEDGSIQDWMVTVTIVEDTIPPVIDCVKTVSLNVDEGDCLVALQFEFPTATDNIDDQSLIVIEGSFKGSNSLPNSLPVGKSEIIWTAKDRSGNISECIQVFTVVDNEAPIAVCKDITVQLNEDGFAEITVEDIDGGSSDNCGIDLISISPLFFGEENIGENEVTLTVVDDNQNSNTCTAIVTVQSLDSNELSVTKLTLINADTDQPLFELEEGMTINIDDLPTLNLTIDVQSTDDVESLQLELTGAKSHTMTENNAVYALYGNSGIDYHGSIFETGSYTFSATPYSENRLGGEMGAVKTLNFEIVEGDPKPFITTWKTDNPGTSEDNQITIPTFPGETYNYSVDWGDGSSDSGVEGNITHTYATAGTYTVSISGKFPRIYFNSLKYYPLELIGDEHKLLTVAQWGDISWSSMESAFAGCIKMDVTATDIPDFNRVTNTNYMFFFNSVKGNSSFDKWEMGSVEEMDWMFFATGFNQNINSWDVSKVTTMDSMFADAYFNQYIGDWDVSSVENFAGMFDFASNFNQDIGNWDVSSATDLSGMFNFAGAFDQDLSRWNVANVKEARAMFSSQSNLSDENYDKILIGWASLPTLQNGVYFDSDFTQFCLGEKARQKLINDFGWIITDAGKAADCIQDPLSVTKITLINADTDEPLFDLEDGMIININDLPTLNLTIDVQATEKVESLQLELSGTKSHTMTENNALYALYGNSGTDYHGSIFEPGSYSFTATPYSDNRLDGTQGLPMTVKFTIVDAPVDKDGDGFFSDVDCDDNNANIHPEAEEICDGIDNNCDGLTDENELGTVCQELMVTGITLINADTDQVLFDLEEGMKINIDDLPTLNLTIDVQATEDVESLKLELSGAKTKSKTENRAPFALYGNIGPTDYIGSTFVLGEYTFTVTPYSENGLKGEMGTPVTITFEIVDELEQNTFKISPNQATTVAKASFERPTEINQIYVFDMSGRLIDSYNPEYIKSGDDFVLDVNFYQQGTYIVKMIDKRGVPYQKQMVVKR